MLTLEKINTEELADIAMAAQRRMGPDLSLVDVYNVLRYTIRKAELNGKGDDYVPVLFENELRDFAMRKEINRIGGLNLCAGSAT